MKDFSRKNPPREFTADGDTFYCTPGVAAMLIGDIVVNINTTEALNEKMRFVEEFFNATLLDDSFELMKERLRSKTNPIDIAQAMDIIGWLVEELGQRPTKPSSSSSDGSATEETGTSSTAGVPSEVSIPTDSPSIGSATSSIATS
jgi:hypothetical protein